MSNGDFYAGSTKDMVARFDKHQSGGVPHTAKFRPVIITWYAGFQTKESATSFEDYLKSSSGKAFRNKHLLPRQE